MSAAQILEEVKTLSTPDLQLLALSLRLERLRRVGEASSDAELRWLEVLSRPLAHAERLPVLAAKWESQGLSPEERAEMQGLLSEREAQNAERAEAVQHLSELTGVPFQALWNQLVGEAPALLIPRN